MPPRRLADWKPDRAPHKHTCVVHTAKASTARIKSKGARGQPYRIPRWGWIHPPCNRPFTRTAKVEVVTHYFTRRTHVFGNPWRRRTFQRNCQSIESYALAKSTFHINLVVPSLRQAVTISSASTTLSAICRPGIKADWNGLISDGSNPWSRLANTFANIR